MKRQIAREGVVTLTDPSMTRFVMTIPQAVRLVLRAVSLSRGQEVFILKMPAARLKTIADAAIRSFAPEFGKRPSDIRIQIIGKRNGEKRHERLLAEHELPRALETKDLYILTPNETVGLQRYALVYPGARSGVTSKAYSSEHAPELSVEEITRLIRENQFV